MAGSSTVKMLSAYVEQSRLSRFLLQMFSNITFHNSESVEIDIEREGEDVAIALKDANGYRVNDASIYTNKSLKPPVFKEKMGFQASSLLSRDAGDNPYADVGFQAKALSRITKGVAKLEKKVSRSLELMASQILQTGELNLVDDAGAVVYTLDFQPKSTHFPTSSPIWDAASDHKIADIIALCNVIRDDSLMEPDRLVMGEKAFESAIQDADFNKRLDLLRADLGQISQIRIDANGGQYRGTLNLGNFKLDVWTYGGRYKHPQTGTVTKYVADGAIIVMCSTARLDASFGAIPRFVPVDQRVLGFVPGRVNTPGAPVDMHLNAWVSPDGETLECGVGSRPLLIPVAIDSFGCLTTGL